MMSWPEIFSQYKITTNLRPFDLDILISRRMYESIALLIFTAKIGMRLLLRVLCLTQRAGTCANICLWSDILYCVSPINSFIRREERPLS